jgi:hypothetical protein
LVVGLIPRKHQSLRLEQVKSPIFAWIPNMPQ